MFLGYPYRHQLQFRAVAIQGHPAFKRMRKSGRQDIGLQTQRRYDIQGNFDVGQMQKDKAGMVCCERVPVASSVHFDKYWRSVDSWSDFASEGDFSRPALAMSSTKAQKDKPLHSFIAGTSAGALEAFVTYPTEFVKTRSQFVPKGLTREGPITIITSTLREKGLRGLYAGCGALVIGNAMKAGVRFVTYDYFKGLLQDKNGKISAPRSLLAGLGAGMTEAIFAVTPSETIKTKLIDDSHSPKPRFKGLIHGTTVIVKEEGIRGIYRGLFPVMARQGANSAVRFTTYATLKQFVQGNTRPGQALPSSLTFAIGAVAGLVTVYTTMPLDVIKTRMQTLQARTQYRNSFHCAYRIFTEEGITRFWTGTTPRLARLVLSGGIVFTAYEAIMKVLR